MITILNDNLQFETQLADLIAARGLDVSILDFNNVEATHILVCSQSRISDAVQKRAIIDRAKKLNCQKVVGIGLGDQLCAQEELGGRIINLTLPSWSDEIKPSENPALLIAAQYISDGLDAMVACDKSTRALIGLAECVAKSDVTVFVNGPTGSGKEVLSRFVHKKSARADKEFVALNCAAIPENMLEAMLFGHEKGSFTGASVANVGFIRAADGGTLLLDEISEMPLTLQSKLLRVLQERVVTPLGSQKEIPVDIRIIATSNRDMYEAVETGKFREDLYYRLNVFPLETMPLAERQEDIPAIATALLMRHHREEGPCPMLSQEAIGVLRDHKWPGNVRELENVIQRALVLQTGPNIEANDIMLRMKRPSVELQRAISQHGSMRSAAA